MLLTSICPPALLYLGFTLTQILIDTIKGLYTVAFFKFIVMIVFTILLNALCGQGLGIISWFIVMVPFVSMTFITTLLMFVFDVKPSDHESIQYDYSSPMEPNPNESTASPKHAHQHKTSAPEKEKQDATGAHDADEAHAEPQGHSASGTHTHSNATGAS